MWVPLACLLSFSLSTCSPLYALQIVNALYLLAFFYCPELILSVLLECECPLLAFFCSFKLTLYSLQGVSVSHSLTFFCCPVLTSPLCSLVCKWPSLAHFLLLSWLVPSSVLSRKWVPLPHLLSFIVLICPSLCTLQELSAPFSLTFVHCPDFFPLSALSSWYVPLGLTLPFSVLTWPSMHPLDCMCLSVSSCWCIDLSLPMCSSECEFSTYIVAPCILTSSFFCITGTILQTKLLCCQCTVVISAL
jgi:hypothetical protein